MAKISKHFYEFGPFRLDPVERQLWRDGEEISLTPKAFGVLLMLIRNEGHAVSKEDFMREVWPDTIVEEKNLTDNVSILRQALGDSTQEQQYIRTIPRRGYRFVADVHEITDSDRDLLVRETSRSRVVIEEDDESPNVSAAFQSQRAPAMLEGKRAGTYRLLPWLVAVAVLLMGAAVFAAYRRWKNPAAAEPVTITARKIAVLPFKPLVPENGDPVLELGMTDALITKLSNIRQLTVRPTSSVLKYSGLPDVRAAGKELGVDVVLDGKVQKSGDRVRLSVQLLSVSDGTPFWGESFDENFTNVFAIQDRVSERVATALSLKLTGEERRGLSKRYTESTEAYQLYLKGHTHWRTFNPRNLLTSINYYQAALEKDPNYALAYAGIASAYNIIGIYGPLTAREAMSKSRVAAQKAIELDETLAQAHVALGVVKLLNEWDWEGARREFERAIELDPNTEGRAPYGYYFEAMRKSDESLAQLKLARELAPGWEIANSDYATHLFIERRYDEAIAVSEQELKLNPENADFHTVLGMVYSQQGKHEQAAGEFERAIAIKKAAGVDQGTDSDAELGVVFARMGRKAEAVRQIERLEKTPIPVTPFWIAEVYTALGNSEAAFASLEKGYQERCPFLWEVRSYPQFDSLRSDARYTQLLKRMNLNP